MQYYIVRSRYDKYHSRMQKSFSVRAADKDENLDQTTNIAFT